VRYAWKPGHQQGASINAQAEKWVIYNNIVDNKGKIEMIIVSDTGILALGENSI